MTTTAERLQQESLRRMRWRLWFAFRDSKYPEYRNETTNGIYPNYKAIDEYCLKHWGTRIGMMTEYELSQKIAVVMRWK